MIRSEVKQPEPRKWRHATRPSIFVWRDFQGNRLQRSRSAKGGPHQPSVGRLSLNTLTLVAAVWTGAAQANGTENYDAYYTQLAQVKECTGKATTRKEMRGCTRVTYDDCMKERPGSRVDESACLGWTEDYLKTIYREQVVTHLDAIQKFATSPAASIVTREEFFEQALQAEVKWNDYRQAQCDLEMGWYGAGNAVSTAEAACHARFYADRIYRLRNPNDFQKAAPKP